MSYVFLNKSLTINWRVICKSKDMNASQNRVFLYLKDYGLGCFRQFCWTHCSRHSILNLTHLNVSFCEAFYLSTDGFSPTFLCTQNDHKKRERLHFTLFNRNNISLIATFIYFGTPKTFFKMFQKR